MLKPLCLTVVLGFWIVDVDLVSAQTTKRQAEPTALASQGENPRTGSAESDRRTISPEASAEARRLYREGVKYGRGGLFKQAAELFQRAAELKPDYADAYYSLGHAYYYMGQWEKAIKPLQQALDLNPKDKEARDWLGQAQLMQRETSRSYEKSFAAGSEPQQAADVQVSLNVTPLTLPVSTKKASVSEIALTKVYRVGPGDVLDVRLSEAELSKSTLFTITPSGLLEHPNLPEPLPVAGLTVEEISARLGDDLKRRALSDTPKVSVGVRDYLSHAILVSGLVKEPGTKILRREAIPLYVVVADAQPLPEAATATLVRNESNELHTIDLAHPPEMNLLVYPGDVITLQANPTQFFYVSGGVKSPGEKTFHRGLTLTQAIIAAGGLTAKAREAQLARDDGKGFLVVSRYKLKEIDSGKLPDPLVQPGDRITIVN